MDVYNKKGSVVGYEIDEEGYPVLLLDNNGI